MLNEISFLIRYLKLESTIIADRCDTMDYELFNLVLKRINILLDRIEEQYGNRDSTSHKTSRTIIYADDKHSGRS